MNRQLICRYRNKRRAPRFREIKFPSSLICKWRFGDENRCHLSSTCRSVHLRFSWTFQYFCHFEVRSKNWLIHNWTWSQKMNHQVTVEDMERNIVSLQITSQLGLKSEYGSSTRCSRHTRSHAVCDVVAEDRSRGTYESANNKRLREVYKVPGGRSIIFSVLSIYCGLEKRNR